MKTGNSARIREYAHREYIEPARKRGETTVRIVAGDVQKALRIQNRIAQVCSALANKKFLEENRLILEKLEGPPSGTSTTVKFTYRMLGTDQTGNRKQEDPLLRLWGIGKEMYESLGGGEAFIRSERENFYGPGKDL